MSDREDEIIDKLSRCETAAERNKLEEELDKVRRYKENKQRTFLKTKLDENLSFDFNYYPDMDDLEFNQKIYNKKEFRDHRMTKRKLSKASSIDDLIFKRTPSQNFTAHYISSYTPYNGILLWHGVGIGKTCTALSIAENFKDYVLLHGKKIIILTPSDTLRETWRNEIFNIDKEIEKYKKNIRSNVQCTGDRYSREIVFNWGELVDPKKDVKQKQDLYKKAKRTVNAIINKYYKIFGYQMLVNDIEKRMKQKNIFNGPEYKKIELIRDEFSNTVIIMDEAHFLRDDSDDENVKKATPYIKLIARYAENSKIILSTATPMYNQATEIVSLLNILLMNDKRAPLVEKEIFNKEGAFIDNNGREILLNGSRGYISYVRSENPFDFPLKLEPNDSNAYTPEPEREWDDFNKKIVGPKIKEIKFYKNPMSDYQYTVYLSYALKKEKGTNFEIKPKQSSNIAFPKFNKDDNILIGNEGFRKCIELEKGSKKYKYSDDYNSNISISFLSGDKIGKFSSKCKNILKSIQSCEGIVFVYSQYIDTGIKLLAMVLEENGFMNYNGDKIEHWFNSEITKDVNNNFCAKHLKKRSELIDQQKREFKQASYIYLDANTKNLNELLRQCNKDINKDGHYIKVILGSRVTGQGLNFKNVREVHIMDPWYHFNALEQSIGRAIRRGSHNALPMEKRNATIYIHTATPTEDENSKLYKLKQIKMETSDEHDYWISYRKAEYMAEVQRLLKENAIDCENNIDGNLYLKKDYENMDRKIRDGKGNIRIVHIYDKDNSLLCDLRKCEMTCRAGQNMVNRNGILDIKTFSAMHQSNKKVIFKEIIKQIFIKDMNYDDDGIINEIMTVAQDMGYIPPSINENDYKLNRNIIFKCLTEMINDKEYVYNYEFRPGIIEVFKGSYVFTPVELDNMNKYIPLLNRDFPNMELMPSKDEIASALCVKGKVEIEEIAEYVEEKKEVDINMYKNELERLMISAKNYVDKYLSYYRDDTIPTKEEIIKYKFQSLLESEYINNIDRKYDILEYILKKEILNSELTLVEKYVLNLYDTPTKNTYVIRDNKKKIVGYKRIKLELLGDDKKKMDINQSIYMRGLNNEFYITTYEGDKKYEWVDIKNLVDENEKRYIGWLTVKSDGTTALSINLLKKVEEGISKKSLLSGALCKSGSIHILKEKEELVKLLNSLRGIEGKDTTREYLCYELELLLRYMDEKLGNMTKRYFYRMDEKDFMDVISSKKK
jgi:hypothetical protein